MRAQSPSASNEAYHCATCQTGGRLLADRALSRLLRGDWPKTLEELEEGEGATCSRHGALEAYPLRPQRGRGTVKTGTREWRTIFSATLPIISRSNPDRPWLPSTTRSYPP